MKKRILLKVVLVTALFTSMSVVSQNISKDALGIKLSKYGNHDAEISWQHKLTDVTRTELNLGFQDDGFKVSGLHEWVWELDKNLFWYAGAGLALDSMEHVYVSVIGNVGVEYNFSFPLQISLDVQPGVVILGDFLETDKIPLSFGIRYRI